MNYDHLLGQPGSAATRLAPFAAQWDRDHTFPKEALQELARLGAFGIAVPEQYGGAGMDYTAVALALDPSNALVRQNYDLFKEINDRAAQKDRR